MYYRFRWYEPASGRFLSEDPIGFEGGKNFYEYVGNAPVSFSDPLGPERCIDPNYCRRLLNDIVRKTNKFFNEWRPYKDSGFVDKAENRGRMVARAESRSQAAATLS